MGKRTVPKVAWWLVLWLAAGPVPAAEPSPDAMAESAQVWFEAQDWEKAASAYEALLEREPSNAVAWFRLGVSRHSLGNYAAAADAYEQAWKHGFALEELILRAALAYARLGNRDRALDWVERALESGVSARQLERIPGLAPLREEARFRELVARFGQPCGQAEYRGFDFWAGEWEVQNPQGQTVGTNTIQKILDGCLLFESWVGAAGGAGKSFNFYHAGTRQWKQTWVDSSGQVMEFEGEFREGAMRFEGEGVQKNGRKIRNRMTFFPLPPDRVRQLIEQSGDGGRTWEVWFEGIYLRRQPAVDAGP